MSIQVSHSAVERFNFCSESYNNHYIKKIREINTSSAFLWGGAIDSGLNELLLTKMFPKPEILPTPYKTFLEKWETVVINDNSHDAKFCDLIEYAKRDLDPLLFNDYDYDEIRKFYPNQDPATFAEQMYNLRESFPWWSYAGMEVNSKKAYNYLCWLCLSRKADMIFQAYQIEILPRIKRVISIQERVDLTNKDGDTVVGYIDVTLEWEDGKIYIADHKTASKFSQYADVQNKAGDKTTVRTSQQLGVYGFFKDIKHGMYIVILKDIVADGRKKGTLPKVKFKIFKDEFDPKFQDQTLSKFELVTDHIKKGVFEKKADKEQCYAYGKKCPYYNLCWGGSMDGLIQKEKKK